jgi:hypothetical protein
MEEGTGLGGLVNEGHNGLAQGVGFGGGHVIDFGG